MDILHNEWKRVLLQVYIDTNLDKDFFILSSKKDAFFLIDLQGHLVYANPNFETFIGYAKTEWSTMQINNIFVSTIIDETQNFFRGKDHESLNTFDAQIVNELGKLIDVHITSFPVFFEEVHLGTYIVLKEISSIKLKSRIRDEKEKYFNKLIEQSPESIFIIKNNKIINVNNEGIAMLGAKNRRKLLGQAVSRVIHPNTMEGFQDKIRQVEKGEITDLFEQQMLRLDGDILNVEMKAFPTIFQGDSACHIIVRDQSERKKLSQISEKHAVAGQLAAGIAHEIRNPITAIKGFLQLIMGEGQVNKSYYEIIQTEISRIEVILRELMVLAKPNKQKNEAVNLCLLLDYVVTLMESQALLNNIQFEKNYRHLNAVVLGDENQLKQVFINYIKNAIDAMPEGGRIAITGSYSDASFIKIEFMDQGCGIPATILERVGNPFFTTKENGTGLGMLVSSQIIKEHNGYIEIKSDTTGTCIEVKLPIQS